MEQMQLRIRLPIIVAVAALVPSLAQAATCSQILQTHGFKAQAQASCGYGQRPNEAIEWARSCARKQSPATNTSEIRMGVAVFNMTEMRMGHAAVCQDVFQKFPGVFTQN